MRLLPLTTNDPAAVSAALWRCTRPDADSLTTRYYCGWITHPTTGQHALTLDETDTHPIHPDADAPISALSQILDGVLPANERSQLEAGLRASKGRRINIVASLPGGLANRILTQEQAEAAGWFAAQEVLP